MKKCRTVFKVLLFSCAFFTALPYMYTPCGAAQAASGVPDINLPCTIEVDFSSPENGLPDGTEIVIYRIACCEFDGTRLKEKYTKKFSRLNAPVTSALDEGGVKTLEEYIRKNNITSDYSSRTTASKAVFTDIPCGVYLVTYPPDYEAEADFPPFTVKLPTLSADKKEYIYTVVSMPKTHTKQSGSPVRNDKNEKLPQTGQLWWPVQVFALLGLIFTAAAYFIRKIP